MSAEKQYMAADLRGPLDVWVPTGAHKPPPPQCEIVALVVASGVAQQFDLSAPGFFGGPKFERKFVRMISETAGNCYYFWSAATGSVLNSAATGGGTGVCAFLPSQVYTDELPAGQYLLIQPQNAGVVRVWVTNRMS